MSALCELCTTGPRAEPGHDALVFYVGGPYPGHHIFKCSVCDERWIRHYGVGERFGWTRYSEQFAVRLPRDRVIPARGTAS